MSAHNLFFNIAYGYLYSFIFTIKHPHVYLSYLIYTASF